MKIPTVALKVTHRKAAVRGTETHIHRPGLSSRRAMRNMRRWMAYKETGRFRGA